MTLGIFSQRKHIIIIKKGAKMDNCIKCKNRIKNGEVLSCPNCGKTFCSECAIKTKKICPDCFHSLEYIG